MQQKHSPKLPPGIREYVCRIREQLVSFDIGPPGFSLKHARVLGFWGIFALLLLPLGVTGVVIGGQADDWEGPIRAAAIGFGAVGIVVAVGPLFWVLSHAWLRRERVQVSPGGMFVRVGHPLFSRARRVADLSKVQVGEEGTGGSRKQELLVSDRRLSISWNGRSFLVGTGLPKSVRVELLGKMRAALDAAKASSKPVPNVEWRFPVLATLTAMCRGVWQLVIEPFRHPVPYIACDLLTIAVVVVLPSFAEDLDLLPAYPALFVAFLVGLWIRRFDPDYLSGLNHYWQRYQRFPALFLVVGFCTGLAGGVTLLGLLPWVAALSIPVALSIWVHVSVLNRSIKTKNREKPENGFPFGVVSSLTLIPLAIMHEHVSFLLFEDTARRYFILALPMVFPVVAFVYFPIRIHFFISNPKDRSNAIWFGLTVVALSIYAVFGVDLF